MEKTYAFTGILNVHYCLTCGIPYGIPDAFEKELRKTHKPFYCPNGHTHYFGGESELEKYKRLYRQEQRCCELKRGQLKTARASFNGLRGYVQKLKKRLEPQD